MNISFLKEKGNKYLIYILMGLLVLVFCIPSGSGKTSNNETFSASQQDGMEAQLESVLSAMEGVGKVKVMIATEKKGSALFSEESSSEKVLGVVIVAEGAGNPSVDARILNAVKALFSIDAHKISIVKMRSQEGD